MSADKSQRVFWLGMHVVLTQTELPRLRELGFEVFNPPYLADVYDQSAVTQWDAQQNSTLPPDVFRELSQFNFFYNEIPPRIAELLNEHFGTVIVTINQDWLAAVLKVFRGRVIYRVYGQLGTLSEPLWNMRMFRAIEEHEQFHFVPHAAEAVSDEHAWLTERMHVVPYTPTYDVFRHEGTWSPEAPHDREVMLSCPNVDNSFYAGHYRHLNAYFPEEHFKLYGVQPRPMPDPRIVGTLDRDEFLSRYVRSAGMFYHYDLSNVCHLPPIEMMIVGGPVVYSKGSLLSRYFDSPGPGEARNIEDAKRKARRLAEGDRGFAAEVIAAQRPIVERYHPDRVLPTFDATFRKLLQAAPRPSRPPAIQCITKETASPNRAYVLFHFPGQIVSFGGGEYRSSEGIPRAIANMVRAMLDTTTNEVVITCYAEQLPNLFGFFVRPEHAGRIRFHVLDEDRLVPGAEPPPSLVTRTANVFRSASAAVENGVDRALHAAARTMRRLAGRSSTSVPEAALASTTSPVEAASVADSAANSRAAALDATVTTTEIEVEALDAPQPLPRSFAERCLAWTLRGGRFARRCVRFARRKSGEAVRRVWNSRIVRRLRRLPNDVTLWRARIRLMRTLNRSPGNEVVVVPHYFLFPEALLTRKPLLLFLPDFTPHFFPEAFHRLADRGNALIGRLLARRSRTVFTCSEYTKSYLPRTALRVDPKKIEVIPMPLLMPRKSGAERDDGVRTVQQSLGNSPFLFYPTQNRPNKQLAFLLELFAELRTRRPELKLVLTCDVRHHPPVEAAFRALHLEDAVTFRCGASDTELNWLYSRAAALCLTSTMEGNFPPQVFEALTFDVPTVATRLPMITEILGDAADEMLLCEPLNRDEFLRNLETALDDPETVRRSQRIAYERVRNHASDERFAASVKELVQRAAA